MLEVITVVSEYDPVLALLMIFWMLVSFGLLTVGIPLAVIIRLLRR